MHIYWIYVNICKFWVEYVIINNFFLGYKSLMFVNVELWQEIVAQITSVLPTLSTTNNFFQQKHPAPLK